MAKLKQYIRFLILSLSFCLLISSCATSAKKGMYGLPNDIPPYPGQLINYNDQYFHVFSTGNGPSIVFISGSNDPCPYVTFYPLWNELKKSFHCIIFDRPGYGWSEDNPGSRDINTVANQLKGVLELANENGPYTIVAVSMGGLEAIRFSQLYPSIVNRLIMLDAATPLSYLTLRQFDDNNIKKSIKTSINNRRLRDNGFFQFLPISMVAPLLYKKIPKDMKVIFRYMVNNVMSSESNEEEARLLHENSEMVLFNSTLSSIPVIYFTAGENGITGLRKTQQDYFSKYYPNSIEIFLKDSPHQTLWKYPNVIIESIKEKT